MAVMTHTVTLERYYPETSIPILGTWYITARTSDGTVRDSTTGLVVFDGEEGKDNDFGGTTFTLPAGGTDPATPTYSLRFKVRDNAQRKHVSTGPWPFVLDDDKDFEDILGGVDNVPVTPEDVTRAEDAADRAEAAAGTLNINAGNFTPTGAWDFTAATVTGAFLTKTINRGGTQSAPAMTVNDAGATGQPSVKLTDNATHDKPLLQLEHGAGVSGAYGLEIHNSPGAASAITVHQYSGAQAAVWIDNTDNAAAVSINNTHNFTNNPSGPSPTGLGDFIRFQTEFVTKLQLRQDYSVLAADDVTFRFTNNATGTKPALTLDQLAPSVALRINVGVSAAGFWPVDVGGQNYGPRFTTATNGGETLTISKNGTGGGTALYLVNKGTGLSIDVRDGANSLFAIGPAGIPQWVAAANQQTTVGAAGGASALPATPTKYLKVKDSAGTTYVIPAYAAA